MGDRRTILNRAVTHFDRLHQTLWMEIPTDLRAVVTKFVYDMWNGLLFPDVLEGIPYRDTFREEPSSAEQAIAIFLNVLKVDASGIVTNPLEAERRAAEYVAEYHRRLVPEPPLAFWETERYSYFAIEGRRSSGPMP